MCLWFPTVRNLHARRIHSSSNTSINNTNEYVKVTSVYPGNLKHATLNHTKTNTCAIMYHSDISHIFTFRSAHLICLYAAGGKLNEPGEKSWHETTQNIFDALLMIAFKLLGYSSSKECVNRKHTKVIKPKIWLEINLQANLSQINKLAAGGQQKKEKLESQTTNENTNKQLQPCPSV